MPSVTRMMAASGQPPQKPLRAPSVVPTARATIMAARPTASDARAPNTRRDSTSRPVSSVPSRCSREGGRTGQKIHGLGLGEAEPGRERRHACTITRYTKAGRARRFRRKRRQISDATHGHGDPRNNSVENGGLIHG